MPREADQTKRTMKTILVLLMLLLPLNAAFCADPDTLTLRGRFYLDGTWVTVKVVDEVIHSISRQIPDDDQEGAIPGPDLWIAPGLIDIQINGYAGIDFADQDLRAEDMVMATRALWKAGVTSFLPTVTTNSRERLATSFRLLSKTGRDPAIAASLPGYHLEGPYISPHDGYRGAHMEEFVREPDWEEFQQLQELCDHGIKLVTVAPETEGALSFTRKAASSGVVVSLGHHNGSPEQIRMAADAGATLSTHLGNGCANMIHRHNNPLWPQLAEDRLSASLIVDGYHLNRDEVICFYRMKGPARTILVSDALHLAGMPPGEYDSFGRTLLMTGEVVKYPEQNVLAGAAVPVSRCVANMMAFTGCTLAEAIGMASTNPAQLLGLADRGSILPGKRADLILFSLEEGKMAIHKTVVAGKVVYSE